MKNQETKEVKMGQPIFGKHSNAKRSNIEIEEGFVTEVGEEYFKVSFGFEDTIYDKETWQELTNDVPKYDLYASKQEILDEQEFKNNVSEIKSFFIGYESQLKEDGITLEKTRKILEILLSN